MPLGLIGTQSYYSVINNLAVAIGSLPDQVSAFDLANAVKAYFLGLTNLDTISMAVNVVPYASSSTLYVDLKVNRMETVTIETDDTAW